MKIKIGRAVSFSFSVSILLSRPPPPLALFVPFPFPVTVYYSALVPRFFFYPALCSGFPKKPTKSIWPIETNHKMHNVANMSSSYTVEAIDRNYCHCFKSANFGAIFSRNVFFIALFCQSLLHPHMKMVISSDQKSRLISAKMFRFLNTMHSVYSI